MIDRGREGEREGEERQCVVASHTPPTGDLACNPGMCPDWESNHRPFGSLASTQSTEPYQPRLHFKININHTHQNNTNTAPEWHINNNMVTFFWTMKQMVAD